jgi:hypothetical protein
VYRRTSERERERERMRERARERERTDSNRHGRDAQEHKAMVVVEATTYLSWWRSGKSLFCSGDGGDDDDNDVLCLPVI